MKLQILLLTCLIFAPTAIESYKILMLAPFPTPSHWMWLRHFVEELLARGHEVTAITNYKMEQHYDNYREVLIEPMFDMPGNFPLNDIFEMKYQSDLANLYLLWNVGLSTTRHAFESRNVFEFMQREDLEFDLILAEQFFQESFLVFAHKYRAPIVTIATWGYSDYMDRSMGLMTPWSFVPHPVLLYTDRMTFFQRCHNVFISIFDQAFRELFYLPMHNRFAEGYFAQLDAKDPIPSVQELEKSISVILVNTHKAIGPIRPKIQGLVDVGGAHIKPPKELPTDIQDFLDGATFGAIYFSLGSYVKSTDMPENVIHDIISVFRNLKQRVLWKYEGSFDNLPENVKIVKWMPQSDVLAHPNIVLFISHGGAFGTQEGLYRGVPMLFIPLYGDQHQNALRVETLGSGLTLNLGDLNYITFGTRIQEILGDKSFSKKAKETAARFQDNPIHPMDEAMFWIEYTIRHKDSAPLKSSALELPFYRYLMLDIIGFIFLVIVLLAVMTYLLLYLLFGIKKTTKPRTSKTSRAQHSARDKKK